MDWKTDLEELRREKDAFFKNEPDSPLSDALREGFVALPYWPPGDRYRVEAKVERLKDRTPIAMEVSKGQSRAMVKAAVLSFELDGAPLQLIAYQAARPSHFAVHAEPFFVPFRDATSGDGSYGAGRYLDLEDGGGPTVTLDFNSAYSPYCAYSDQYSCPLPPRENWLAVRIEAGERELPK